MTWKLTKNSKKRKKKEPTNNGKMNLLWDKNLMFLLSTLKHGNQLFSKKEFQFWWMFMRQTVQHALKWTKNGKLLELLIRDLSKSSRSISLIHINLKNGYKKKPILQSGSMLLVTKMSRNSKDSQAQRNSSQSNNGLMPSLLRNKNLSISHH